MPDHRFYYVYVARQPILDRRGRTFGYELLYREGLENFFPEGSLPEEEASRRVLVNALFRFGIRELTYGKKAFINFTLELLRSGLVRYFRPQHLVIEILERTKNTPDLLEICQELYRKGYALALDDFDGQSPLRELLPYMKYIKIDFRALSPESRAALARELGSDFYLVAEKIETREEYEEARDLGFHFFQGFYFARPKILASREIPVFKQHYLRLLGLLQKEGDNLDEIIEVIQAEPSLTLKLLRYINSAFFGFPVKVRSVRHTAVLLGKEGLRKWGSLATLFLLAADQPPELIVQAVIRAKFMESLAEKLGFFEQMEEAFLVGLFSLLEPITDQPLFMILKELPLEEDLKKALLGEPGPFTPLLSLVENYERGVWERVHQILTELDPSLREILPVMYREAVKFAHQIFALGRK
ncbi:EAL and HDOD domain-containing protein [Thermosulfurimonas marina]|nr:EAL domain-containing protein [Thermosulfurimonas marina]